MPEWALRTWLVPRSAGVRSEKRMGGGVRFSRFVLRLVLWQGGWGSRRITGVGAFLTGVRGLSRHEGAVWLMML
jgi:hypothetical protein